MAGQRSRGSDEENEYSVDGKSPMPPQQQHPDRPSSVGPANGINGVPQLHRQQSDYYLNAISSGMAVPAHLRPEMQPTSRPQSPAYTMPINGQSGRSTMTSNPNAGYNPPQILEPQPNNGQQPPGSGNNSPHIGGAMGWQSPHNGITATQQSDYTYPDPNAGYNVNGVNGQMYYQQPSVQRPHSTGPVDYHNQMRGQEMWAQHQQ
jgi:hypothetical protein